MDSILKIIGRQEWIRFGIRDRLIRQFHSPESDINKDFLIDFFGFKYKGNTSSFLDWNVYFYGAYEKANLLLFQDILRDTKNSVCLDIGANIGHHSLYMSSCSDSVHAFEPNPSVRSKIIEKIKINAIKNIHIHEVGLGLKEEKLHFFEPKGTNKGTGSFIKNHSDNNDNLHSLTLRVVNADDYISKLSLQKINLIKIDVEGFERFVLEGSKRTFDLYRPAIIIEFSETTRKSFSDEAEFYSIFPKGYAIKKITYDNPYFIFFNSPKYKIESFDFNKPGGDLLAAPTSLLEKIQST